LIDRNVQEINNWIAITREFDQTRTWISGDGETQAETDLPTVIGHYGGNSAMDEWSQKGKPWGIGETGMGYYGTPSQVSKVNGDRAFESQLGRMEGLAGEAFDNISRQRNLSASYTCVFNLAWYGHKPLALGLSDITRAPELKDGIFFNDFVEGKSGYQPERLGPYTSTFNPGYDPTLPLYEPWPMFDAVKAAYADNYKDIENQWGKKLDNTVKVDKQELKQSIVWLAGKENSSNKDRFENMAVKFDPLSTNQKQLIFVDGSNPPSLNSKLVSNLKEATQKGSTLLFWGATENSKELLETLTYAKVEFYNRKASSYVIKGAHPILRGESNRNYYFSELTKKEVSDVTIGGEWVEQSQLLLEACNTDWHRWNYNGEDIKTASVYRSEREAKPAGNVIVRQAIGEGELIVSTLDLFKLGNQATSMIRNIITSLGGEFKGQVKDVPDALNADFVLENALFLGAILNPSADLDKVFSNDPISEEEFTKVKLGVKTAGLYWNILSADGDGIFQLHKLKLNSKRDCIGYLSFWMYSPRSLTDLLIEPNMPRLDMHFGVDDALAFSVNGKVVKEYQRVGAYAEDEFTYEGIPLEKGWNHVLIKVGQGGGEWSAKVRFSCTKPEFFKQIKTVVDR
jgi:beta-galactosidase